LRPADGQTVVIVNPADCGSDALVVTAAGVRVVPLPDLITSDIRDQVARFQSALDRRVATHSGEERLVTARSLTEVLDWLWRTTTRPILEELGHTDVPAGHWPRIHWCPTWQLGFLPFHAAAAAKPVEGSAVLDRVISSYTPSLRILRFTTGRAAAPPEQRSLLVVSMPDTPGLPPLPGARREVADLTALSVPATVLDGDRATHDSVSRALLEHAWAHFACHAGQDLKRPSRSRLFLHDHARRPLTVLDVSRLRVAHGEFAFLSACATARGGADLPDEALHMGTGLQLAGYQHVIATLWQVKDTIAAEVSAQVYRRLRVHGAGLNPARTATALHTAIRGLRHRYRDDPILWASHIHIGP
jgi:CHAT domain-containing protein